MSHNIATNFSMPNLATSLTSKATKALNTSNASGSSDTSSTSSSDVGSTFLSLLVQELQNQDPTAPMDSTAMVGQMISLNQLDQLVSINQTLSQATSSDSAATSATSSVANAATKAALQAASGSAGALAMMFPASQLGKGLQASTTVQNPFATSSLQLR